MAYDPKTYLQQALKTGFQPIYSQPSSLETGEAPQYQGDVATFGDVAVRPIMAPVYEGTGDAAYKTGTKATGQYMVSAPLSGEYQGYFRNDIFDAQGNFLGSSISEPADSGWGDLLRLAGMAASFGAFAPLTGALSGALSNAGLSSTLANVAAKSALSGTFGGLGSLTRGEDFLKGFGESALTSAAMAGFDKLISPVVEDVVSKLPSGLTSNMAAENAMIKGVKDLTAAAAKAKLSGQDIDFVGALLPSVAQGIADEFKLPVRQVTAGLQTASKLLQGGELGPEDLIKLASSFNGATAPTPKAPASRSAALQEPGAGYGGADFGFFDPQAEASLPRGMSPMDMASFLEANVDDPATVDQLMQQYFPELYAPADQRIPITAQKQQDEGVIIPDWDIASSTAQKFDVTGTRLQSPQFEFPGQFVDEPRIQVDPNQRIDVTGSLLKGPEIELPQVGGEDPRMINVREGETGRVEIVGGGTRGPRTIVDVPDVTKIKPDEELDGTKIVEPDLSKDLPGGIVAKPTTPATKPPTTPATTPADTTTQTVTRTPGQPTVYTPIMAQVDPFDINSLVMQLADRGMTTDDLIQILRG